jgi:dual specificity tyrosine-phosphorylation-regulated kinase 2/3/4
MIPLVLPQKFQFNQPQAQPVMKQQASGSSGPPSSSSSSLAIGGGSASHQDDQLQQLLCSRKNSLPHSSNLINNNHTTTTTSTATISSNNELNVNGVNVSNRNNGKMCPQPTTATSNNSALNTSTNVIEQQQQHQQLQHQNGNQTDGKSSSLKCPVVASPHQVMMLYMNKLTPYEHHEIYKYSEIYFIGANAKKRSGPNDYDNDNGSYIHIPHDHIAYRYEVLKIIGKGSFGQVVKAYDHKTREHVALKMVRNEKRFHRQAQEEIRILKHLRAQDKENTFNIIHM